MPTVAEQIEHLKTYDPSMPCAMAFWQPDDVKAQARQMNVTLTDEQIGDVLYTVHSKQDCEYGISWTTIQCAIEHLADITSPVHQFLAEH